MNFEKISNINSEEKPPDDIPVSERKSPERKEKLSKFLHRVVIGGWLTVVAVIAGKELRDWHEGEFTTPEDCLELIEKDQPLSSSERENLKEKIQYIKDQYSGRMLKDILGCDREAKETKTIPSKPTVRGFEQIGVHSKDFARYFSQDFYPKGWLNGNVPSIELASEMLEGHKDSPAVTEGPSGSIMFSLPLKQAELEMTERVKKELFPDQPTPSSQEKQRVILSGFTTIFDHELAHANDWRSGNTLTLSERFELLHDATRTFNSLDPEVSLFTDSTWTLGRDKNNPEDRRKLVTEWWAEVWRHYLTMPETMKKHYKQEFDFADANIKYWQEDFDPIASQGAQNKELFKIYPSEDKRE